MPDDTERRPATGRVFAFHAVALFALDPAVARRDCDLAVLHFCASQIVSSRADLDALLGGLLVSRRIPWILIGAHDHLIAELPTDGREGVCCRLDRSSGCSVHPLVCTCPETEGSRALLRTTVAGSTTAVDIAEYAFGAAEVSAALRRLERRLLHGLSAVENAWWPYRGAWPAHWLLRTLVEITIHAEWAPGNHAPAGEGTKE